MTSFWRKWLDVWCWAVVLFGVVLAGAGFAPTDGAARVAYGLLGGAAELEFDRVLRVSMGLLGAVTIGWGLCLMAAIRAALLLEARGAPIWTMLTVGMGVWYVVDSVISVATGFGLNAVSNTIFLAGYLLPVLRSGVLGSGVRRANVAGAGVA